MPSKQELLERYKSAKDVELFTILRNRSDYTPEALEAAQEELDNRQLSNAEQELANKVIQEQVNNRQKAIQERKDLKASIIRLIERLYRNFNFFEKGAVRTDRIIRGLAMLFGIICIHWLWENYWMFSYVLSEGGDSFFLMQIAPKLLLFLGTIWFIQRQKKGWMAVMLYFSFYLALNLPFVFDTVDYLTTVKTLDYQFFYVPSEGMQYQADPPYYFFLGELLFFAIIYTLSRKDIKEVFEIRPKDNRRVIFTSILAAICVWIYV